MIKRDRVGKDEINSMSRIDTMRCSRLVQMPCEKIVLFRNWKIRTADLDFEDWSDVTRYMES
jgi:hypothetical protein